MEKLVVMVQYLDGALNPDAEVNGAIGTLVTYSCSTANNEEDKSVVLGEALYRRVRSVKILCKKECRY